MAFKITEDQVFQYRTMDNQIKGTGKVLIRTIRCKEGICKVRPFNNDVAHIWIDKQMYRITKKGTVIMVIDKSR